MHSRVISEKQWYTDMKYIVVHYFLANSRNLGGFFFTFTLGIKKLVILYLKYSYVFCGVD